MNFDDVLQMFPEVQTEYEKLTPEERETVRKRIIVLVGSGPVSLVDQLRAQSYPNSEIDLTPLIEGLEKDDPPNGFESPKGDKKILHE